VNARLALSLSGLGCAALLAACAGNPPPPRQQIASARPVPTAASGEPAPTALAVESRAIADALTGNVLVTGFTNPTHGEGVAEVVYYGRNGQGMVDRLAAREPGLKPFRWEVRTRRPPGGQPYVFISGDGRDDGAAVRYSSERQSLTFSDSDYGRHFAYGIIQNCWPSFVPTRPPSSVRVCDAAGDAMTLRRLEAEQAAAIALRANQSPVAQLGLFTTRPGGVYTNSLGNTLTVRSVDGVKVTFVNQNGAEFTSHALLYASNPKVQGNDVVFAAIDQLFPLEVGKTAEAWVYNADWAWQLLWKVTRREPVTTPAGTFDAWLIEHTETAIGAGYIGRSETWYAPGVGWNVRHKSWTETQPSAPTTQWELTRARVGGRDYPQSVRVSGR
jgi:hypothetical protein